MKTFKGKAQAANFSQQGRHLLGVDAELLGAATHLHARTLQLKVRVDAHCHPRRQAKAGGGIGQHRQLAKRLHIDQHTGRHRLAQLQIALARPGETDFGRLGTGVQRHLQLPRRCDIDTVHQTGHQRHQRRHRVGLHRVMQLHPRRQGLPQRCHAGTQEAAVVGIKRRLSDPLRQQGQRLPADDQLAVLHAELRHWCVHRRSFWDNGCGLGGFEHGRRLGMWLREYVVSGAQAERFSSQAVDSALRSILPFGLRGSGPA